ncbi:MAG: matrixin family metalloprotease [Planctomycetota bacterium]|nr:matrixin family metalloprotease [Planctomycetota bacterium]
MTKKSKTKLTAMPIVQLLQELRRNGWTDKTPTDEEMPKVIKRYQRAFGLRADGWAGPITSRTLTERFCSVPDHAMAAGSQWPRDQAREGLTVAIASSLAGSPRMTKADYSRTVEVALAHISEICGARFELTTNTRTANVVMGTHRERSGGVLAWSQLPNGSGSQLDQSYDDAESWHWRDVDVPSGAIGLIHVIRHEWGHAMGLGHGGNWLLRPTYDPRAYEFWGWELDQMLKRYGEPQDTPGDPPTGGKRQKISLVVEGVDLQWDVEDRS